MKNPLIAERLKFYRKKCNLSVEAVSKALSTPDVPVAKKTVYGWESGHTQPDADTLMRLCDLYHIDDILGTFGYRHSDTPPHLSLSRCEKEIIRQYRRHSEMHDAIHRILYMEEYDVPEPPDDHYYF